MGTCAKCGSALEKCEDCHGTGGRTENGGGGFFGNLTCSTCNSTGKVCPNCGKHYE